MNEIFLFLISFLNLNYFSSCMFLAFLIILFFFLFYKINYIRKYENELVFFESNIKNKHLSFQEFYKKLLSNQYTFGLSYIFISGFQEFIILHNRGVYNLDLTLKIIEKIMLNALIKELSFLHSILNTFKAMINFFLYFCFIFTLCNLIIFFQNMHMYFYNKLSFPILLFSFNEVLVPFFLFSLIAFIINIIYHKYLLVIFKISTKYYLFLNDFLILVIYKFSG